MGIWRQATPWSMSPRPALERPAAWMEWFSRRTYSGSSPSTPPGRIWSTTLPLEIFFQSSPIFSMTLYQTESAGARVAMMISIFSTFWARAVIANPHRIKPQMLFRNIAILLYVSFFMFPSLCFLRRRFQKQFVDVVEQPPRAALRHQIGQAVVGVGVGIHGEGLFQQRLEFRGVLRRHTGIFGEGNVGAGALALGELDGTVEVLAHELLRLLGLDVGACRLEGDEELRHSAIVEGFIEFRHTA